MTELQILKKGKKAIEKMYDELSLQLENFEDTENLEADENRFGDLQTKVDILEDIIMLLNHGEI